MARVVPDKRLVEDEVGLLEARLDVAGLPLVRVLAERELPGPGRGEILFRPLQFLHLRPRGRGRRACPGSWLRGARRRQRANPGVALRARVGTVGPQRFKRIDRERQRLVLDLNPLDRFGRGELVHRRHGQNRLAVIQRLHRQAALAERARDDALTQVRALDHGRQIVDGQDRFDARHRERRARVDAHHARMRHRAAQQLREQHPLGAEVFRVLRLACHLRDEVRGRIVLAD